MHIDTNTTHKPSVLLVDDDSFVLRLLSTTLNKATFAVDQASDGIEAMRKVATKVPSLLILDLSMPNLDGLEVCRAIRKRADLSATRIIVLTGNGEADRQRCLTAGADQYLTKPFSPLALVREVRRLTAPTKNRMSVNTL